MASSSTPWRPPSWILRPIAPPCRKRTTISGRRSRRLQRRSCSSLRRRTRLREAPSSPSMASPRAAPMQAPAKATEIGLVLQGGGALGAYEYGAITALLELIDEAIGKGHAVSLKAVTGVSIGAINAACVVGAASRTDARRRLASLWNDLVLEMPMFWPGQARRDLALYGLPNFYSLRADMLSFASWTHVYDTRPLLPTLMRHVDFAELNASDTAFVVTAVDVQSGVVRRFSNKKLDKTERTSIEPHHVLASGSLPPQFPWTEIKEGSDARRYWDGGIVDNTPLTDAIDAFSVDKDVRRLLVVMNLFPQGARLHAVRGYRAGR